MGCFGRRAARNTLWTCLTIAGLLFSDHSDAHAHRNVAQLRATPENANLRQIHNPLDEQAVRVRLPRRKPLVRTLVAAGDDEVPKITYRTMGEKELLVIRIEGLDGVSTTASTEQLIDDVFADDMNVATQFKACSHGRFTLVPATGSPNIDNGIITVALDEVVGREAQDIYTELEGMSLATSYFGRALHDFDKVMICMPPGVIARGRENWIAFVPGKRPYLDYMTVYSDEWCSSVSAGMHEMGHNLGLQHSGEVEGYDDEVGQMGFSEKSEHGPLKCFNPAKSWQLGWYADRSLRFDPMMDEMPFSTILAGIIEDPSESAPSSNILLQIPNGETDYYIGYNRQQSFNSGTDEGEDMVLVTEQPPGGMTKSVLLAKLGVNESYRIPDFQGMTGKTLVIAMRDRRAGGEEAMVDLFFEESPNISNHQPQQKSTQCADMGRARFTAWVVTDGYPQDTSWTLTKDSTGQIVISRDRGTFPDSKSSYVTEVCLDRDGSSYTFTFFDAHKDGICCSAGYGGFTGFVDGREVFRGGEFSNTERVTHSFVVPATPPPTATPSHSPTNSPTIPLSSPHPVSLPTVQPTVPGREDHVGKDQFVVVADMNDAESDKCENLSNYRYKDNPRKSCEWVAMNRTRKRCEKVDPKTNTQVKEYCPRVCKITCRAEKFQTVTTEKKKRRRRRKRQKSRKL